MLAQMLLAVIAMTFFVSCTGTRQDSVVPVVPGKETVKGTGDSGGGNLYQGRPIESYAVDVTKLASYQKRIQPILNALSDLDRHSGTVQLSNPDLGRMLLSIVQKKTWYLIPGELESLPKERIGAVVPTEQAALQGFREVWINSLLFHAMSEEDQSTLLLHEILMGIRILKFDSYKNQCLSYAPEQKYCDNISTEKKGHINQLNEQDYADIRAAGIEIFKNFMLFNFAEWNDLMGRYHFDMANRTFQLKGDEGQISREEFIKRLRVSEVTGHLPQYGYTGFPEQKTISREKCQIRFENLDQGVKFKLQLQTMQKTPANLTASPPANSNANSTANSNAHSRSGAESKNLETEIDLSQSAQMSYQRAVGLNAKKLERFSVSRSYLNLRKGDRFFSTSFLFDFSRLVAVEIHESICTEDRSFGEGQFSCGASETPANSIYYLCSEYPEIEFAD